MTYLSNPEQRDMLKRSQLEWIKFRDKDCEYRQGPQDLRGSMDQQILYDCMSLHTERRIEDLKSYVSCRENGCPY